MLDRELRAFFESEPLRLTPPTFDSETEHFVMFGHSVADPTARLGLLLGDYVNNVRSALDHLVWQLVLYGGHSPNRRHNFPICDSSRDSKT